MGDNHKVVKYDIRHNCGRLLFRGFLVKGTKIDIRCPRCNKMMVIDTSIEVDKESEPAIIIAEVSTE